MLTWKLTAVSGTDVATDVPSTGVAIKLSLAPELAAMLFASMQEFLWSMHWY